MTDERQICPGDEDWFSIQLNRSEILTVELLFDHSQRGDLDMEIYRAGAAPDALEIIQVSESSTDDETAVTLPAQEPRTYFVRVYGFNGASNNYLIGFYVSIDI